MGCSMQMNTNAINKRVGFGEKKLAHLSKKLTNIVHLTKMGSCPIDKIFREIEWTKIVACGAVHKLHNSDKNCQTVTNVAKNDRPSAVKID